MPLWLEEEVFINSAHGQEITLQPWEKTYLRSYTNIPDNKYPPWSVSPMTSIPMTTIPQSHVSSLGYLSSGIFICHPYLPLLYSRQGLNCSSSLTEELSFKVLNIWARYCGSAAWISGMWFELYSAGVSRNLGTKSRCWRLKETPLGTAPRGVI